MQTEVKKGTKLTLTEPVTGWLTEVPGVTLDHNVECLIASGRHLVITDIQSGGEEYWIEDEAMMQPRPVFRVNAAELEQAEFAPAGS